MLKVTHCQQEVGEPEDQGPHSLCCFQNVPQENFLHSHTAERGMPAQTKNPCRHRESLGPGNIPSHLSSGGRKRKGNGLPRNWGLKVNQWRTVGTSAFLDSRTQFLLRLNGLVYTSQLRLSLATSFLCVLQSGSRQSRMREASENEA